MNRPWQDTSPAWLSAQYGNAQLHADRVRLHAVCSQDPRGWYPLLFKEIRQRTPSEALVFELGSGEGDLWWENRSRIPAGWQILLSDQFPGMIETGKRKLRDIPHLHWQEINGNQPLPFPDKHFHTVVANHMLYHLSSVPQTLKEIHRILKPRGVIVATTTGPNHMAKLFELIREFEPKFPERKITPRTFDTINGARQLRKEFTRVERLDCLDTLKIKHEHIDLAVNYIYSWHDARQILPAKRRSELLRFFERQIEQNGPLLIDKEQAIFIGTK